MCFIFILSIGLNDAYSQSGGDPEISRGRSMLSEIKKEIKKYYYDENHHGMDVEARFKAAEEKMKQSTSLGQTFSIIAQAVADLDDSHTFFIPPSRAIRTEYGWQMQMLGDRCFIIAVKPGSDADGKGVKIGDEVLAVNGIGPTRNNFWKLQYLYHTLRPQPGLRVDLKSPAGGERQLELMAKVENLDKVNLHPGIIFYSVGAAASDGLLRTDSLQEINKNVIVWQMTSFAVDKDEVDKSMEKVRKYGTLILDLRNNRGGYVSTLEQLAGYFVEQDVQIAERKGREKMDPMVAKAHKGRTFTGKLVVMVNSESASAAEMFARLMQLEKRGVVIGDVTAGAVMQSSLHHLKWGGLTSIFYAASITNADVIMKDGKSLEHVGVMPDELLLPSAADLAAGRDPVLTRAAAIAGAAIEPEKAAAMFPLKWKK
jgi:C-terminal processing protease CtpA/Prc